MIQFRCPKCEQPVEVAAVAAGRQVLCPGCRAMVLAPGTAKGVDAPSDSPLNRRQWYRQFFGAFAFLIPLVLVALGVGGYALYQRWFAAKVWLYVDNTGERPLTVRLDGDVKTTVAPGAFAVVKCREGSRRIQVSRGDETVFEDTKELCKPAGKEVAKYLLNPEATGRYATHSVQYGVAFMPWGLANLRPHVQHWLPLMANDANLFPGWNEEDVKRDLYWASGEADINLVEPAVWQDISKFDIVLERAPKQIKGEITGRQEVFARLPKADFDAFTTIRSNQKMTKPELAEAVRAMERILEAEMPR